MSKDKVSPGAGGDLGGIPGGSDCRLREWGTVLEGALSPSMCPTIQREGVSCAGDEGMEFWRGYVFGPGYRKVWDCPSPNLFL